MSALHTIFFLVLLSFPSSASIVICEQLLQINETSRYQYIPDVFRHFREYRYILFLLILLMFYICVYIVTGHSRSSLSFCRSITTGTRLPAARKEILSLICPLGSPGRAPRPTWPPSSFVTWLRRRGAKRMNEWQNERAPIDGEKERSSESMHACACVWERRRVRETGRGRERGEKKRKDKKKWKKGH